MYMLITKRRFHLILEKQLGGSGSKATRKPGEIHQFPTLRVCALGDIR